MPLNICPRERSAHSTYYFDLPHRRVKQAVDVASSWYKALISLLFQRAHALLLLLPFEQVYQFPIRDLSGTKDEGDDVLETRWQYATGNHPRSVHAIGVHETPRCSWRICRGERGEGDDFVVLDSDGMSHEASAKAADAEHGADGYR